MQNETQLYVKQLKPYLYLLDENHEATGYLVIGDEKALLIDTMNGYTNLKKAVQAHSVICYSPENV